MYFFVKIVLIVCLFVIIGARPAQNSQQLTRKIRQVVQPTWLDNQKMTNKDGTVRVTNESLQETEELRKVIQEAVDAGIYVHETPNSSATFTPTVSGNMPSNLNLLETPSATSWTTFLGNMNDFFATMFTPISLGNN